MVCSLSSYCGIYVVLFLLDGSSPFTVHCTAMPLKKLCPPETGIILPKNTGQEKAFFSLLFHAEEDEIL